MQVMVMAQIYTNCGKYEKAIGLIEYLLSLESSYTVNDFKMDPMLKPLRGVPEFKALMEKYALPEDLP
jgi:hypothetical protein